MSSKSSILEPQHHKSIQELAHEDKIKREKERQKVILHDIIIPFLKKNTKSMYEAGMLVSSTKTSVEEVYKEIIMAEQAKISGSHIEELGIDERLEKAKKNKERELIELLKGESLGKVCAMLEAFSGWSGSSREAEDKKRSIDLFPFIELI